LARDHIPTLEEPSEVDATGRVGEIYGDLRQLAGVPVVALIFRRLATLVGLLDHIWLAVRPLMAGGLLQDAAQGWQTTRFLKGLSHSIDALLINI
jgi:hypothetical protein